MTINHKLISGNNKEIYRRFPEVKGKKPSIRKRQLPKTRSIARSNTYLLTYKSQALTVTNRSMPYCVRVVANEKGKILKITMSH